MPREALTTFEPLRPPFWARGPHAQTLLGHFLPSLEPAPATKVHFVSLKDGDQLAVHEWTPAENTAGDLGCGRRSVVLFHGLGGSADADYMQSAVRVATQAGLRAFAVEHRGAGAGRGLAKSPYNSGSSADAGAAFTWLAETCGLQNATGIGFSLSGNVLLKLACEGGAPALERIVAVNPPCDLAAASARIGRWRNRAYELRFMLKLNRQIAERVAEGLLEPQPRVSALGRLREFDERITAPLAGYESASDYYARCSTHERLEEIRLPSLILIARDDPFVDSPGLERARRSNFVELHVEERGGHMGYLGRGATPFSWSRWLDEFMARILR